MDQPVVTQDRVLSLRVTMVGHLAILSQLAVTINKDLITIHPIQMESSSVWQ